MYMFFNIVYFSLISSKLLYKLISEHQLFSSLSLSGIDVPQNYFKEDNIKIQYNNNFRIKNKNKIL